MPDNILKIGQKLEMTRYTGRNASQQMPEKTIGSRQVPERTLVSQLMDVTDDSHIYIAMPMEGGRLYLLETGDKYNLFFYAQTGLYHCVAKVENRYRIKQIYMAEMVLLSELERYQRRQFYRMNCILDITYRKKGSKDTPDTGVMIDISGGGARFNSKCPFEPGDDLELEFTIQTGGRTQKIAVLARVISSSYLVNRMENKYENRIEFLDLEGKIQETIVKYIFEEERRRRKNEKI